MSKVNLATVDVEDWFHLLDFKETECVSSWKSYPSRIEVGLQKILDLFQRHGVRGTFFILGWVAREYPDLIKEIRSRGHDIGSHSFAHQLVFKQTPSEFRDDLLRAEEAIEYASGILPRYYRAPGFSITGKNLFALRILAEQGYLADCSIFPAKRAHGGCPEFANQEPCLVRIKGAGEIVELPINTKELFGMRFVFSGGGYFRLIPKFWLQYLFSASAYNMTYFHPRDLDPEQPMLSSLPPHRKFKSYYNLAGTEDKLDHLLASEKFMSVSAFLAQVEAGNLNNVELNVKY